MLALMLALWAEPPTVDPHVRAEVGASVRQSELDSPGAELKVPVSAAAGIGAGLSIRRAPERREAGFFEAAWTTSLAARALESLPDQSSVERQFRTQSLHLRGGAAWELGSSALHVQVGVGLGYRLRAWNSILVQRIPPRLSNAAQLVVPFTLSRGRLTLRTRAALGPSFAASALAAQTQPDVGIGVGLSLDFELRIVGGLALGLSARDEHDMYRPEADSSLHLIDGQQTFMFAIIFDRSDWKRPRP